jgi:predicted hotdog family 3-hydroxylacyl-ACP dehydratase
MTALPAVTDLVPHADGMLLIDRMLFVDDERARSESTIRPDNIFFQPGRGIPAYVGFELMAQTINAFDGFKLFKEGKKPMIGFLLGCRKYSAARPFFTEGETVTTEAAPLMGEIGMASFECRILDATGAELASATINVYRPEDPEAFLASQL